MSSSFPIVFLLAAIGLAALLVLVVIAVVVILTMKRKR